MLLAELEIRHSRPVAPTRRVALGFQLLPCDPPPGWGGVLLAGMVAANIAALDPDDLDPLDDLIDDLEAGARIAQPRLRHRFQRDTVGLDRSRHSLIGEGERIYFDLEDKARPAVTVLGALYAAAELPGAEKPRVFGALRKAVGWNRGLGDEFVGFVLGDEAAFSRWRCLPTDERWALKVFGFRIGDEPSEDQIRARFRDLLRRHHPDHGAAADGAGARMVEIMQARRILLGV